MLLLYLYERKQRSFLKSYAVPMKMTPKDEKTIIRWEQGLSDEMEIRLIQGDHNHTKAFIRFCEDLSRLAPSIRIKSEKDADAEFPAIEIGEQIVYHALPLGPELEPFLIAISTLGDASLPVPAIIRSELDKNQLPALLKLYITGHCPFCPNVARQLITLQAANRFIRLKIIDGTLFPALAQLDNIKSAPTVILDSFRFTGSVQIQEIANVIVHRDPAKLAAATLQSMIHEGAAEKVAQMMLDKRTIFPAFIDLLTHEKWSVRLGAMVAMEEVIERNRELAAKAITPLWQRIKELPEQVQGDMIYLIGEMGNPTIIPRLEKTAKKAGNSELSIVAYEAIQRIKERN
jgi:hypothetical protein